MAPVCELRRKSRSSRRTPRGPSRSCRRAAVTFEPAVTYSPASTTQLSPRLRPTPALAPMRLPLPMLMTSVPPPGQRAHDRGAAADVGAVVDDDARRDPALDHRRAERAGVEVDEALVHDDGARRQVGARAAPGRRRRCARRRGRRSRPCAGTGRRRARSGAGPCARRCSRVVGDAVDGDGADVGPRDDRQHAEDAVEVDGCAARTSRCESRCRRR